MAGILPDYTVPSFGAYRAPAAGYTPADFNFGPKYNGAAAAFNLAGAGAGDPSVDPLAPVTVTPSALDPLGMGKGGIFGNSGLGMNIDTAKLGLAGISTLGSLWGAMQSLKLANKQFDYTKSVTDTNLANQIKSYNTGLQDRADMNVRFTGGDPNEKARSDAYVAQNKLTRS